MLDLLACCVGITGLGFLNTLATMTLETPTTSTAIRTDLLEDTVYEFEVSTQSRCGRQSWSDPVFVKTMSVPGPVQNLQVLNKTNSTVTVGWTPLDDVIQYYFTVIFPTAGGSTQEYKTLDPGAVNHTFTGLLPYTWYTVKIAASSALSVGKYSHIEVETETNRVDPNLNVTLDVEIQPNYEVALSWAVSDRRETSYLYKLTIKKLSGEAGKEKRNFQSPQIRNSGAEFQVDGKNSPFIEIKTSLRALTVKGLVHHAPYQISVAICPDPTSLCRIASEYRKIFVAFAEQYYYQQFYSGPGGPISHQTVQNMVVHATQNSSSLPHFSITNFQVVHATQNSSSLPHFSITNFQVVHATQNSSSLPHFSITNFQVVHATQNSSSLPHFSITNFQVVHATQNSSSLPHFSITNFQVVHATQNSSSLPHFSNTNFQVVHATQNSSSLPHFSITNFQVVHATQNSSSLPHFSNTNFQVVHATQNSSSLPHFSITNFQVVHATQNSSSLPHFSNTNFQVVHATQNSSSLPHFSITNFQVVHATQNSSSLPHFSITNFQVVHATQNSSSLPHFSITNFQVVHATQNSSSLPHFSITNFQVVHATQNSSSLPHFSITNFQVVHATQNSSSLPHFSITNFQVVHATQNSSSLPHFSITNFQVVHATQNSSSLPHFSITNFQVVHATQNSSSLPHFSITNFQVVHATQNSSSLPHFSITNFQVVHATQNSSSLPHFSITNFQVVHATQNSSSLPHFSNTNLQVVHATQNSSSLPHFSITNFQVVHATQNSSSLPHFSITNFQVVHATQNSSSLPHFSITNITPTSFLGKLTFSNQIDGSNVTQGEMWYKLFRSQGTTFQDLLLGPSFQLSPVHPSGYCDFLVDEEQGKGNFTWPYVREFSHVVLPCNLSFPNSTETRTRRCGLEGWEEEANYSSCPYSPSTSGDIQRLLDTKITNVGEAVEVSKRLTEVTTGTMTTETIGMASQAITQIVSSANNPDISFNVDVAVNLAGALGNIQSLGRNKLANENSATAAQNIVKDVETYCQNLTGDGSTLVNYATSDLKLAVVKLPDKDSSDIFIESNSDSEMSIDYKKKTSTESQLDRISVKVPKELVNPESNVLAVIYKDKSMFLANDQGLSDDDFNIPILSLSINTIKKDSELENAVLFSLTVNDTNRRQPVCVYWDTEGHTWTTEGVVMVYSDDKNIICKTTHLTSFSALLLPAQDDYILSIISQIGTSISIVCLFATVFLLYIVRCVRECMSTKIHINFALALFLALLFFMINTNTTYPGTYCKAMAGLTHYFFLSTFLWMSVEAVGLYRAVVLVFTTSSNKTFLLGAAGVAWGLPAVLVIVLLFLQQEVYQIHPNLSVCWLSKDWMYGTFFSPLLIMVLFNCLVFFRVLWTIIKNKHSRSKGSMKPGQRLVELRIIFSIMSLLGLTWIFGVIQVSTPHIVLEYLFAITNTLQGVAVFVFYCLYNTNIRQALWRVLHGQSLNESASNSSSQQKMKKRRMSIKKATQKKLSIVKAHIDGNPFAFSFGDATNSNRGSSTLKKMDRKNWKKLKKNDIQHTNSQLNDTINSKGATVLTTTGPHSITMPTLSTCYSPASSPTDRSSKQSSSSKPSSERYTPDPHKLDHDDVMATKNCDGGSENDIMLDNDIVLEVDKDSTFLRGSSERCSTPENSRSGSRCSSPPDELNLSQTSSYEKLGEEEKSVEDNCMSV
ncbi:hypothetical protein ACHWQZ_G013687 [Mnemiopsis leidyi]